MIIYIRGRDNERTKIECQKEDKIRTIKEKYCNIINRKYKIYVRKNKNQSPKDVIENPELMLDDHFELAFRNPLIDDHKTIEDYGIKSGVSLRLIEMEYGGGMDFPFLEFTNVDKMITQKLTFSPNAPKWRIVTNGLNIFGICQNDQCKAFNEEVIHMVGINIKFNLNENIENIKCPICEGIIIPKTCGFWRCEYQFIGDKIEKGKKKHINTQSKETNGDDFEYFNPNDNGTCNWKTIH